jgi:uncharacterized oxidoreductase
MDVNKAKISAVTLDILQAIGTPYAAAVQVTNSLVSADQRGFPTHGLSLIPLYLEMAGAGIIKAAAEPAAQALGGCIATIDGQGAFGQLTGRRAVDYGLELVQSHGIAAVGIVDGTHLGRLGEWAERACDAGAAFLAFANTGGGALNVAGAGGSRRVLAPNPIAFGIPTCGALATHVIVDFATSQVAGSRIRELANAGERLNPDWVITENGGVTDDPQAFLDGLAALRPLGGASAGHKGFGLMVAVEMLSALAGGLMAGEKDVPWFSNGALFIFLDISRFVSKEDWGERAKAFASYIDSRGYRLPGSGSNAGKGDNLVISDHTVAALLTLAGELDVDSRGLSAPDIAPKVTQTW